MIKFLKLLEEYGGGPYELPKNHKAGMKVPYGGSCCANCKWWVPKDKSEKYHCINEYYQKWAGTDSIPYDPKEYCTDWWEPRKGGTPKKTSEPEKGGEVKKSKSKED
jgi:hypothetical protein